MTIVNNYSAGCFVFFNSDEELNVTHFTKPPNVSVTQNSKVIGGIQNGSPDFKICFTSHSFEQIINYFYILLHSTFFY